MSIADVSRTSTSEPDEEQDGPRNAVAVSNVARSLGEWTRTFDARATGNAVQFRWLGGWAGMLKTMMMSMVPDMGAVSGRPSPRPAATTQVSSREAVVRQFFYIRSMGIVRSHFHRCSAACRRGRARRSGRARGRLQRTTLWRVVAVAGQKRVHAVGEDCTISARERRISCRASPREMELVPRNTNGRVRFITVRKGRYLMTGGTHASPRLHSWAP
jgi:hypothetical protein